MSRVEHKKSVRLCRPYLHRDAPLARGLPWGQHLQQLITCQTYNRTRMGVEKTKYFDLFFCNVWFISPLIILKDFYLVSKVLQFLGSWCPIVRLQTFISQCVKIRFSHFFLSRVVFNVERFSNLPEMTLSRQMRWPHLAASGNNPAMVQLCE